MAHSIAVIGLGVMGHRMLTNMTTHGGFAFSGAWDPSPDACRETRAKFPHVPIADSADAIIADDATDVVYIACPPAAHREYVVAAARAGKVIFCEKPLGIDIAESRAIVDLVEKSTLRSAVNFPFATAAACRFIEDEMAKGTPGAIAGADIRLHFSRWPRDWQAPAAWLAFRAEGGFVREVLSHFIYLVERLLGPATLGGARVRYPEGGERAETHVLAELDCAGVPVSVAASSGGAGPDRIEFTLWGARTSYRLWDWNRLKSSDGGDWVDELTHMENPRQEGYMLQLDTFQALLDGRPHGLASFRDALSVQELIEQILAS